MDANTQLAVKYPSDVQWFAKGTRVRIFGKDAVAVEDVENGDLLLGEDGEPCEVESLHHARDNLIELKQFTRHRAHIEDPTRLPPFGVVKVNTFERAVLTLATPNRAGATHNTKTDVKLLKYCELMDHMTNDGRIIKLIKIKEIPYPSNTPNSTLQDMVKIHRDKYENNNIEWQCEVGDLKYLSKWIRASTKLLLCPISFEIPWLLPWLEWRFQRKITERELEAMSWMLGFWIGDGCRKGALFALNSEDHDVNGKLEENAKIWGMSYEKRHYRRDTFGAFAALHTPKANGNGRHWNVNNPFIAVLEGLRFYGDGIRNGPKNVPIFLRTDQLLVRKCFMAGVIDSDGHSNVCDDFMSVEIASVYPPIRDGVLFVARSLGINVSVHIKPGGYRNGMNCADAWLFTLSSGSNRDILLSILKYCSHGRKKDPPIFYYHKMDPDAGINVNALESNACTKETGEDVSSTTAIGEELEMGFAGLPGLNVDESTSTTIAGSNDSDDSEGDDDRALAQSAENFESEVVEMVSGEDLDEDGNDETDPDIIELDTNTNDGFRVPHRPKRQTYYARRVDGEVEPYLPNEGDKYCIKFHKSRQRFRLTPSSEEGDIIGLKVCEKDHPILSESQIIYGQSSFDEERSKADYELICYSCKTEDCAEWRIVPWPLNYKGRLCRTCYETYSRSQTRCSNTDCRQIFHKGQLGKKAYKNENQVKLKLNQVNASAKHKYLCHRCSSVTITEGELEHVIAPTKYPPRDDTCYTCGPKTDRRWHKRDGKLWCNGCYKRFANTRMLCPNSNCRKIPSAAESTRMKCEPGSPTTFQCLACKTLIEQDTSRPALKRHKLEERLETCHSCGPIKCKIWCSLPWDMKGSGLLCNNCRTHYRTTGGVRCLNDACGKILKKSELPELNQKERTLSNGSVGLKYLCIYCHGDTNWNPDA
ncbi:LANO_0F15038g1_1 [Lachancea nothofagi CBS 11611]|uniref:LANO_0F15038g1_1 n=1 Tax=Lachancea nothofagi CBS 11611 TaxID=1266666 RepID=A0A1G4KCH8_9SACH|nr:LANO_0F15038g1_1 [Lachancea nothofagi CBS 11611]